MHDLESYFLSTTTFSQHERCFGIEIETLVCDSLTKRPISRLTSQQMMSSLVARGWSVVLTRNDLISEIQKSNMRLRYDCGWNMFELITPAMRVADAAGLFADLNCTMREFNEVTAELGAFPLQSYYDGDTSDTQLLATRLDELYVPLNGAAIVHLCHVAAVHFNFDVRTVDEGFSWIRRLNAFYSRMQWPPPESRAAWHRFIDESIANYEMDRYGPPPESLKEFCAKLGSFRVYVDFVGDDWQLVQPARPFVERGANNMDMFVSYVWWWSRFRIRNGRLTLELRAPPRTKDSDVEATFGVLRQVLEV
jgi:hypothetical protein